MRVIEPAKGGRGKKGGVSEAAREIGIPRSTAKDRRKNKRGDNTEIRHVSPSPPEIASDHPDTPNNGTLQIADGGTRRAADAVPTNQSTTTAKPKSTLDLRKMSFDLTRRFSPLPKPAPARAAKRQHRSKASPRQTRLHQQAIPNPGSTFDFAAPFWLLPNYLRMDT